MKKPFLSLFRGWIHIIGKQICWRKATAAPDVVRSREIISTGEHLLPTASIFVSYLYVQA